MGSGSTPMNGLVGAVVTVVLLPFLGPFSSVVGGTAAGYLQRGDLRDGLSVGALAGALAVVPLLLFVLVVSGLMPLLGLRPGFGAVPAAVGGGFLFLVLVGVAFTVALSALGGAVGVYLESELNA